MNPKRIHLLHASQTGNAEDVACQVEERLTEAGHQVIAIDLCLREDISFLSEAECILGVVSTWGDGEPPDDAVPFFDKLRESASLNIPSTPIAILGLGDSGYDLFCECGKELQRELLRHGATTFLTRVDCDAWYDEDVEKWISDLLITLQAMKEPHAAVIN